MVAPVPALRPRPVLSMKDMGMGGMDMTGMDMGAMDHSAHGSGGSMNMRDKSRVPDSVKVGVGVDAIAMMPVDRTGDPGIGLEDVGHRVLTYRDLDVTNPGYWVYLASFTQKEVMAALNTLGEKTGIQGLLPI